MSTSQPTRRRDWTSLVWRSLCVLAAVPAAAVFTGLWWWMPALGQALLAAPGLVVTLLLVLAWFAESSPGSGRR
ncbi:hypothetical protein [Leucobacter luti]|uniref:hypothetical protein n=1 Tax=Leucobacter luti TaxID=340320 RepID=UPI003CFBF2B1